MMTRWAIMSVRTHITMDPEMQRRAFARAAELSISFDEYLRRLVARDLEEQRPRGFEERPQEEVAQGPGEPKPKADLSIFFDLIDEGPPTSIARDKDKLVGEAVWQEYLRKTGRERRRRK
jgi:hypothetical protein